MSEVKFRINEVTSQHPKYPAGNLVLNQEGWQTGINCQYPQSITIQFYVPIRTKKLHLLFHQYKIPKLIEVFIKLGARANYRKLGHVMPNDNSQSDYQEKEQKTLYFEFSCTHIRLVIHENYKNNLNIFNQVALEDLIVIGEVLSHQQIVGVDLADDDTSEDEAVESMEISHNQRTLEGQQHQGKADNKLNVVSSASPLFKEIYEKLEAQKEEAVDKQEYQKAAHIKGILSNFRSLENQINRLESQKAQALKNEDYDRCHRIKLDINKKKEVVQFQRNELFRDQEQFYSHNVYERVADKEVSPIAESKRREQTPRDTAKYRSPEFEPRSTPQSSSSYVNPHDERVLPALLNKGKLNYDQNLPLQTNQKRKDAFVDVNQSVIPELAPQNEYSSLKKDVNQIRQLTERQGDNSVVNESIRIDLEPLENKLRIRVENYFDFLPEKLWQLCESKNWKGKLQALKVLKEKVQDIETKDQFMGTFEMLSRIIVSKQAVISIETLQILSRLTELNIKFTLQHLPFFVEDIILELLNFLNDTNSKIKELSYMTYFNLPRISFLNLSVVVRELIKHKNKVKNDPKLIITKLQLMTLIVENYKEAEYNFKEIMNWVSSFLEDPNHKVKSTAGQLLVAVAYLVGSEKILKAIEDMKKPELLEIVFNLMNTSFDHSKINEQSKLSLDNSKLHQQFYGAELGGNKSNRAGNPSHKMPQVQPIYGLKSEHKDKLEHSKNSKRESDNANFQLSYSRESMYEESLEHMGMHKLEEQGQIRVLEEYDQNNEAEEEEEQDGKCTYCNQSMEGDEKNHYVTQCRVLAHCKACNCLIYLRDFTDHLLNECDSSHMFKACKKCGIAYDINEISSHIAEDICKKKLGVNWQRCQFCSADVMGEDDFWIKHAHECMQLPDRKDVKANNESYADQY